jgi:hypothetical protein
MEAGKNHTNKGTQFINIDGKLIINQQSIANTFNAHFCTIADKIKCNVKNYKTSLNGNSPAHYFHKTLSFPLQTWD